METVKSKWTPQRFSYPSYEDPLLAAYGGQFECVYVLLHPFRAALEESADLEAVAHKVNHSAAEQTWAFVTAHTHLKTYPRLNQALLTSIRALREEFCDFPASAELELFLKERALWEPTNGSFESAVINPLLSAFISEGMEELIFIPELADPESVERLSIGALLQGIQPLHFAGSLVAPDSSFLLTVDWDSYFTLFFGPRDQVSRLVEQNDLEGFFADASNHHHWFNEVVSRPDLTT